ncbi:MAG: M14 family zinc carboxypeptidase [Phycisphaerales bacterium JB063]
MSGAKNNGLAGWIASAGVAVSVSFGAAAQQTLTFSDAFQSGSYWSIDHDPNNAGSTTDDIITIEPVRWSVINPESAQSSNPSLSVSNDHWWWAFEVGSVGGLRPTFQVNTSQAWFGNYGTTYSPMYRYVDGQGVAGEWHFFDVTTQAGSTYSFRNDAVFEAGLGSVQISYGLPYTPEMASTHTQSLINHPRVTQTASALFANPTPEQFGVIGQTPTGHVDLIRTHRPGSTGTVTVDTGYDLIAYTVTDPWIEDAGKQQVVLMGGNHASEHQSSVALQGMVDFLASGHPIAELLLDGAEFHVYPIVDPEGRALGQTRGNDSAQGFGQTPTFVDSGTGSEHIRIIDHNRVWDRAGSAQPYEEVDTVRDAIIRDTSDNPDAVNPTTNIDYLFDFHGYPAGGGGDDTPFELYESGSNADFTDALRALTGMSSSDILNGSFGAHPGMAERWAFLQGGELDAEHAFTPEVGVAHQSAALQTPHAVEQLYLDHGEDYARALAAVLLPSNTVVYNEATSRFWNSAGWQTLSEQAAGSPSSTSHALIAATTNGVAFTGPSTNTTLNALTVFGYGNTATRGTPQPLRFDLQPGADLSITGLLHIENARVGPGGSGGAMGTLDVGSVRLVGYEYAAVLEVSSSLTAGRVDLLGGGAELRLTGGTTGSHFISTADSRGGRLFIDSAAQIDTLLLDAGSTLTHTTVAALSSSLAVNLAGTLAFADDGGALLSDVALLIAGANLDGVFDQVEGALFADGLLGWSLDYLVEGVAVERLNATVRFAGDATGDDFVGVEDLDLILANWGSAVTAGVYEQGDFTGDGLVNGADLQLTLSNWSVGAAPEVNIPEPGTWALLGIGFVIGCRRRRRSA